MLIEFFDYFLRFGAIVNLIWWIIFLSLYSDKLVHRPIIMTLGICAICHLIIIGFDENAIFGPLVGAVLEFLGRIVLVMIWLLCLSLFQDNFKLKPLHIFVLGLYFVRSILYQLDVVPDEIFQGTSFALRSIIYIYLIYIILSEYSDDLLEKRRIFRLWFSFALILVPFVTTLEKIFISDAMYLDRISLIDSLPAFLISGAFLIELIRTRAGNFFSTIEINEKKHTSNNETNETIPLGKDGISLTLLEEKMRDGLYREPGLTVSRIAEVVNIPEHRLRKLINHYMGHQNVSQYLNNYRIAEAKTRLADANQRQVSILEIAMDIGYVSLRPFNRAFKDRTDQTPSSYRKACFLDSSGLANNIASVKN